MKKIVFTFLTLLLLAGCSYNNSETAQKEDTVKTVDLVTETEKEQEKDGVVSEHDKELSSLEEYEVISEKIDLDAYQAVIEKDNNGNRIILFADKNGHKVYKSIYIKRDNRLKIISLDDDGMIYNEMI
ncbi:lipoprotein [Bacillus sp. FSL K6-3431]|uniref:lipoprotein n=1 Tax=Bacillus sp. FSL K6-3431 TaxID=2921500 RepID=UPI0030F7E412